MREWERESEWEWLHRKGEGKARTNQRTTTKAKGTSKQSKTRTTIKHHVWAPIELIYLLCTHTQLCMVRVLVCLACSNTPNTPDTTLYVLLYSLNVIYDSKHWFIRHWVCIKETRRFHRCKTLVFLRLSFSVVLTTKSTTIFTAYWQTITDDFLLRTFNHSINFKWVL